MTRSTVLASLTIHLAGLALVALMMTLFPGSEPEPEPIEVVFYDAKDLPPPPPPVIPEPEPELEPEPQIAKVEPPPPPVVQEPEPEPEPKPEPVRVARVEPPTPKPEPRKVIVTKPALQEEPKPQRDRRPAREVKTNLLNAAATKPAAVLDNKPRATSTGAFSDDTNGVAPPTRALRGGSQPKVGGFVVSENTAPVSERPTRTVSRGSGFGGTDPNAKPGNGRSRPASDVSTGGFGRTEAEKRPRGNRTVKSEKPDTPVEILSKPTPAYSSKARELRVEGEVSLRVTFLANGEIKVLEVLEGLGHGLDEAATDAAKRIRFKPARRDRQPVDHTVVLRIVFQLV